MTFLYDPKIIKNLMINDNTLVKQALKKYANLQTWYNSINELITNLTTFRDNYKNYMLNTKSKGFSIWNKPDATINELNEMINRLTTAQQQLMQYTKLGITELSDLEKKYPAFTKWLVGDGSRDSQSLANYIHTFFQRDDIMKLPEAQESLNVVRGNVQKLLSAKTESYTKPEKEATDMIHIATLLVQRLQSEASADSSKKSITSDNDIAPKFADLDSPHSFAMFLANNNIKFNGKNIVIKQSSDGTTSNKFAPEGLNTTQDFSKYKTIDYKGTRYQVEPELFKQAVIDIRKKAYESKDKLFILLVGALAKNSFEYLGINVPSKQETDKEDENNKTKQYADDVLDRVRTQPIWVDPEVALKQDGPKEIRGKDLANPDSLWRWANTNDLNIQDKSKPKEKANESNICSFLNTLYIRANNFKNNETNPDVKPKFEFYFKLVSDLRTHFNCPMNEEFDKDKDKGGKGKGDGKDGGDKDRPDGSDGGDKDGLGTGKGRKGPLPLDNDSIAQKCLPFVARGLDYFQFEKYLKYYRLRLDKNLEAKIEDITQNGNALYREQVQEITQFENQLNEFYQKFRKALPGGKKISISNDLPTTQDEIFLSLGNNYGLVNNFCAAVKYLNLYMYRMLEIHNRIDELGVTEEDLANQRNYANRYSSIIEQVRQNAVYNSKKA